MVPQDLRDMFSDDPLERLQRAWDGTEGSLEERLGLAIDILFGIADFPPENPQGDRYPSPPAEVARPSPRPKQPYLHQDVERPVAGPSRPIKVHAAREGAVALRGPSSSSGVIDVDDSSSDSDSFDFRVEARAGHERVAITDCVKAPFLEARLENSLVPASAATVPAPTQPALSTSASPVPIPKAFLLPQSPSSSKDKELDFLDLRKIALDQLLTLLVDIDPTHIKSVIDRVAGQAGGAAATVEALVDSAMDEVFSDPKGYPKRRAKRKADNLDIEDDGEGEGGSSTSGGVKKKKKTQFDYLSKERTSGGGYNYGALSQDFLVGEFPLIPVDYIRRTFLQTPLLVPTFFALRTEAARPPSERGYVEKKYKGKGKSSKANGVDLAFEAELEWLQNKLREQREEEAKHIAEELLQRQAEESGEGIECGCCFGTAPFERCFQCEDGHLFCASCIVAHVNNEVGSHKTEIFCMNADGCKAPFPESELRRGLPAKTMDLLHRLIQQKHLSMAGLEGLESCPFCNFSICIENPDEKLFVCQYEECAIVSCRSCKKKEHLPKSCEEMVADSKLDLRHHVEEEMTKALIRVCPNKSCARPTIKEAGCNKMTCGACRTLFCYVCAAIVQDYSHFDQQPDAYHKPKDSEKCPLWEDLNARTENEVREARERAQADLRAREGRDNLEEADLNVDLPVAPARAAGEIPIDMPHVRRPQAQQPQPRGFAGYAAAMAGRPNVYAALGGPQPAGGLLHPMLQARYQGIHFDALQLIGPPLAPPRPPPPLAHAPPALLARVARPPPKPARRVPAHRDKKNA